VISSQLKQDDSASSYWIAIPKTNEDIDKKGDERKCIKNISDMIIMARRELIVFI
jgi:hypothetical protein